jgi:imidazolonepropionase-like amidohydrolase
MTRMGNLAGYRAAFIEAQKYREAWDRYEAANADDGKRRRKSSDGNGQPPARDLRMETLAGVLRGDITVQIHCYRADEMALMMDLAREFDFEIAAFHHGVEAYKLADGERAGLSLPPEHAIRWLTANAAKAIGVADQVGTLEEGKMADVVLWNGNPFSVYAKAEKVYVDGALLYDRNDPARQPVSDFMLGQEVSP